MAESEVALEDRNEESWFPSWRERECSSKVPMTWAMTLSESAARFLRRRMLAEIAHRKRDSPPTIEAPIDLSDKIKQDLCEVAIQLTEALYTPGS